MILLIMKNRHHRKNWKVPFTRSSAVGLIELCEKKRTVVNFFRILTSSIEAMFLL